MRTVLLASLRVHARRYVAAGLAIVIGVGFVVATGALVSSARNGMVAGVGAPYDGADVVVSGIGGAEAEALVAAGQRSGAAVSVLGWVLQPVLRDGRTVADSLDVGSVPAAEPLRWQEVEEGRFPTGPGEAVVDVNTATAYDIGVDDRLRLGRGQDGLEVTVVGVVDSPSSLVYSALYVSWSDLSRWADQMWVDSVAWAGDGSTADQLAEAGKHAGGGTAQPRDEFVQERQTQVAGGVDVLAILLLLFAAVALFVAVLVIANTFSIVFAQRRRDLALLRCVGATRKQLLRSVRAEALGLGVAAGAVGLLAGTALGYGLVAGARAAAPDAMLGDVEPSPGWYAGGFLVALVATLVAAWLPTRRTTAVAPVAALHPDGAVDVRSNAGRLRVASGVVVAATGVALLAVAVAAGEPLAMVAGGVAAFSGLLLLGPVVVPALVRLVAPLVGRVLGPPGRLAGSNALRNPRRTAATTASLLVGVTLTTAVLTGMASSRVAVEEEMDVSYPVDATVVSTGAALPSDVAESVAAIPDVRTAVALQGTHGKVTDVGPIAVVAAEDVGRVTHGTPPVATPAPDEIFIDSELVGDVFGGEPVTVTVGERSLELTLQIGGGWGTAAGVAPETLEALTDRSVTTAVWLRAEDAANADDLTGDLEAVAVPLGAEVSNDLVKREYVDLQLDIVLAAVLALLGISVVIALVGIGNTLGLSVLERGREHALLRALGLTRRQLKATLAAEAVLLSVVATLLGTAVGVAFGAVGVHVLVAKVVAEVPVVVPYGQLAVVVAVAAGAGLAACLLPARRAARTAPAAGLTAD
jgi:putative ABC transport system permease protein